MSTLPSRPDELLPASTTVSDASLLSARGNTSSRYLASEVMRQRGYNPLEKLMDLADLLEKTIINDPDQLLDHSEKLIKIHLNLAKFYAPQPKSVDVNITSEQSLTIQTVDFTSLVESRKDLIGPPLKGPQTPSLAGAIEVDALPLLEDD